MNWFSKHKIIPFSLEFILKIFPIANFSLDILIKYVQFLYKEKKKSVTPVIITGELSLSLSAVYKRQTQTDKQIVQAFSLVAWEQPPSRRDG